ncbi:MAG TPA: hypothetical protein VEC01_14995 [Noviherbaspirillum sp.]|uniref:hypothetical protein n=1 Tax=Noviherbaspirillum sp. TaxID=1926288 RepID=UPI002D5BF1E6|nr:hypothetical protein [Noviherbaspirillum sp.]HYD96634.1 hypothetical protein [Noviherbaspirillum sp.]
MRLHLMRKDAIEEERMGEQSKHLINEADVGSGSKSPAQKDVEREMQSISGEAGQGNGSAVEGRMLQSGTHLARILARAQPDGTYEAQVYVRLTREPEVAETYIPAGTFPTEAEAWSAAEDRARRAFEEHEF